MKAKVVVDLKSGMLDPEGQTVNRALNQLGFDEVKEVSIGKIIELDLEEDDRERAKKRVEDMCRRILANPVIHNFEIKIE